MCGRFAVVPKKDFAKRYRIKIKIDPFQANFNVSPGMIAPVIVNEDKTNTIKYMKWGFYPFQKPDSKGFFIFNTKAETATTNPFFEHILFEHRCLVPCIGFYEWEKSGSSKRPYLIHTKSTEVFSLAGIYFKDANNPESFSIITTAPNTLVSPIHNRMPVVIKKEDEDTYINTDTPHDTLFNLLATYPAEDMDLYQVSTLVSNPQNNGENLIQPV